MSALELFVALHALLADPAPAPPPQTLLLLRFADQSGAEGERLREQVAVYMRDLGIDVQSITVSSRGDDANASLQAAAAVRERSARLAFWCDAGSDAKTVTLHLIDASGVMGTRAIARPAGDPSELYRAVALKLRAIVSGVSAIDAPSADAPPAQAASDAAAPRAPPTAAATPSVAPPSIASQPQQAPGAAAPRPWTSRLSASAGYQLTVPGGLAPASQALALEAALMLAEHAELVIGSALSGRSTQSNAVGQVALLDLPVRAGARVVGRWPRHDLAAGAFGSLHALFARASDVTARQVDAFAWAGGAGLEILARPRITRHLLAELRAYVELPLPRTRFWVDDAAAFDFGPRVGLTLGLVISGR